VTSLRLCLKSLRFLPAPTSANTSFELSSGQVLVSPSGTDIATVDVQQGTYSEVELLLEFECDRTVARPSVNVVNQNGNFSSLLPVRLRFLGELAINGAKTV